MEEQRRRDLPCVQRSQELGGRLPMAVAAGKRVVICIVFCDATKGCYKDPYFSFVHCDCQKKKSHPYQDKQHYYPCCRQGRWTAEGFTQSRGVTAGLSNISRGRARTQASFAEKRHGTGGRCIGVCCDQLAVPWYTATNEVVNLT